MKDNFVRKEKMPPEHLRKLFKAYKQSHRPSLGAMKYLPLALHNLLSTMPMPWEPLKYVTVLYHTSGSITFVVPMGRVRVGSYKENWLFVCRNKRDFIVPQFPLFDDDERIPDDLLDYPIPEGVECSEASNTAKSNMLENSKDTSDLDCNANGMTPSNNTECGSVIFPDYKPSFLRNWKTTRTGKLVDSLENNSSNVATFRVIGPERFVYPNLYTNAECMVVGEPLKYDKPSGLVESKALDEYLSVSRSIDLDAYRIGKNKLSASEVGFDRCVVSDADRYKRQVDINLLKSYYYTARPKSILIRSDLKNNIHSSAKRPSTNVLKELKNTRFFQQTELDWVEAGLQVVYQGHRMLDEIIKRKKLSYLVLDYNFNLKPLRALTTKERKKSRVGTSFHLTREILKLVKYVVDSHLKYRKGEVDSLDLCGLLKYIFGNVGTLTGIYRYKYKVMKQIKMCKALAKLMEEMCDNHNTSLRCKSETKNVKKFSDSNVEKNSMASSLLPLNFDHLWAPEWRVWVFMLRGYIPLLQRYISNLVTRMTEGRNYNVGKVTKQRVESNYDIELKNKIIEEVRDLLEPKQVQLLLLHFNEAWRCWKADIPYSLDFEQRGKFIERLLEKYINVKAEWYISNATSSRIKNKVSMRKKLGKIARLYIKEESRRQEDYLTCPFIRPKEAVAIYRLAQQYFKPYNIPFPNKNKEKFLSLAIEKLKVSATQEELEFYENLNYSETLYKIEKNILSKRTFNEVELGLKNTYIGAVVYYKLGYFDKLVDMYLNCYLMYEADKISLFSGPSKVKEVSNEKNLTSNNVYGVNFGGIGGVSHVDKRGHHSVQGAEGNTVDCNGYVNRENFADVSTTYRYKFYGNIQNELHIKALKCYCSTLSGILDERCILYEGEYRNLMECIDPILLTKLLRLVLDPILVDYIISKNNCNVVYKDMKYTNTLGFIKGLQFSPFIYKFYNLLIDVCVLGSECFGDGRIMHYYRNYDRVYVVYKLDLPLHDREVETDTFCDENTTCKLVEQTNNLRSSEPSNEPKNGNLKQAVCFFRNNVTNNSVHEGDFYNSILNCSIRSDEFNESDYLHNFNFVYEDLKLVEVPQPNSNFKTSLSKKDIFLGKCMHLEMATRLPPCLGKLRFIGAAVYPTFNFTFSGIDVCLSSHKINSLSSWFTSPNWINIAVNESEVLRFTNKIRHIVDTSASATFIKVANRWNSALLSFTSYFREAIYDTPGLPKLLIKLENRIKSVIKAGINSKMPVRFPPVLFYSPREVGGLGMYSVSAGNCELMTKRNKESAGSNKNIAQNDMTRKSFVEKLQTDEFDADIPSILEYINRWDYELENSDRVWNRYASTGEIELDLGLPRMSTLLQRNKVYFYDRYFRLQYYFGKYCHIKTDSFAYTNTKHDGVLWNLDSYKKSCIEALGGFDSMLKHTLFKATYSKTFSKLFWEEASINKPLTNAQRTGVNQIPNRRFVLWWSPTINRANVYVGYQVQLDQTRIFMHGKLPTLKVAFVQIFRSNLWQKIHDGIVEEIADVSKEYWDVKVFKYNKCWKNKSIDIEMKGILNNLSIRFMEKEKKKDEINDNEIGSNAASLKKELSSETSQVRRKVNQNEQNDYTPSLCEDNDQSVFTEAKHSITCSSKKLWISVELFWGDYDKNNSTKYAEIKYKEYIRSQSSYGIVVAIDLCYNTYSFYGHGNDMISTLFENTLHGIIQHNLGLQLLRERLRKTLQIYAAETEVVRSGVELYNSGLLVDEKSLLKRKLFIMDPSTGNLYSYVISSSKMRKARSEAAEIASKLADELKKDVCISQYMVDAMDNYVVDSEGKLRVCEFIPSFHYYVHVIFKEADSRQSKGVDDRSNTKCRTTNGTDLKRICTSRESSSQNNAQNEFCDFDTRSYSRGETKYFKPHVYQLYADWRDTSKFTNFCRLMLIIKALSIDDAKVLSIIGVHTDAEWIKIEVVLKDIIINNYCAVKCVDPTKLSQNEIRDIVFGLDKRQRETHVKMDVPLDSSLSWKKNYLEFCKYRQNISVAVGYNSSSELTSANLRLVPGIDLQMNDTNNLADENIKIPKNLLLEFANLVDRNTLIFGLIISTSPVSIALVPQYSVTKNMYCTAYIPEGIQPIGILMNKFYKDSIAKLCMTYKVNVIVLVEDNTVSGFKVDDVTRGTNLVQFSVILSDELGVFYVPEIWNFAFMKDYFDESMTYSLQLATPMSYYDSNFRVSHFTTFYGNGEDKSHKS